MYSIEKFVDMSNEEQPLQDYINLLLYHSPDQKRATYLLEFAQNEATFIRDQIGFISTKKEESLFLSYENTIYKPQIDVTDSRLILGEYSLF